MFAIKKLQKEAQYLYLLPVEEGVAQWEIFDQEELDKRVSEGLLQDGCRLFKLDKEVNVSFERVTHLE